MACLVVLLYVQVISPLVKRVTHGWATTVLVPGCGGADRGRAGLPGGNSAGGGGAGERGARRGPGWGGDLGGCAVRGPFPHADPHRIRRGPALRGRGHVQC